MDLRQLRYVIAVAEELSFTRAAERCHVSQPPLSRAIRDLELEIGAQLFERDKHHVALTAAGASLVADAKQALAVLEDGAERAQRIASGLSGNLTIGFGGSTLYYLLPSLVRRFREAVPDVRVRYVSLSVTQQIEALRDGLIDIGLVRMPVFDEQLETGFVHSEPIVVALPTGHRLLAETGPLSLEQLAGEPFVAYEPARGFNFHADFLSLCRLARFEPTIVQEAPSTEAVIGIVACGEGVALVPASSERLRFKGVSFRSIDLSHMPAELAQFLFGLAWNRTRFSSAAETFVALAMSDQRPAGA